MKPDITLKEFLERARRVTTNWKEAKGEWQLHEQWDKINEEDDEFRNAENPLNELEEFWDCFFARLTLLHLEKVDDYAIFESASATLNKITKRSEKAVNDIYQKATERL